VAEARERCAAAGYRDARFSHTVSLSADLRAADVKVTLAPGARTVVRGVEIRGHRALAVGELLACMDTDGGKVNAPGQVVDEARLEADALRMNALLYDRGFVEGQVEAPRLEPLPGGREVKIVFTVREGERYTVSALALEAEAGVGDVAAERALLRVRPGEVFSRSRLKEDMERVRHALERRGVAVAVEPETTVDRERRQVAVRLRLSRSGAP
jgi:outer membrane protein insertion porin family